MCEHSPSKCMERRSNKKICAREKCGTTIYNKNMNSSIVPPYIHWSEGALNVNYAKIISEITLGHRAEVALILFCNKDLD